MTRHFISRWSRRLIRPWIWLGRGLRYRFFRALGWSAGDFVYHGADSSFPSGWGVALRLPSGASDLESNRQTDRQTIARWCGARGLPELRALDGDGVVLWSHSPGSVSTGPRRPDSDIRWFYAPGALPELDPAHLRATVLIAAAEAVDAVLLVPDGQPSGPTWPEPTEVRGLGAPDLLSPRWRPFTLFRANAFEYSPADDHVVPRRGRWLAKVICQEGAVVVPGHSAGDGPLRRGPYRASLALPARLEVGIRDAGRLPRLPNPSPSGRKTLLVTTPFLARGGAEQTLWETLRVLVEDFDITLVTLAPHRPELDDRRDDFRALRIPVFSFGDWVHPAAMVGMLCSLVESLAPATLYNANGTTLFYDFVPRLRAQRPSMRIVDHLYDHRVGYIERYDRGLLEFVDACVAENHPIREALAERGWPAERVPVIWPCGRGVDAFPPLGEWAARRRVLRRQLDLDEDAVVFLMAARLHPQKRPLDLVRLARRLRGSRAFFLLVGGGDLADEIDAAIAHALTEQPDTPIRRLGFRDDIPELIVAADVGCLISDYEGLPVFLLECLQAGRPFFGTEVGDLGRVLRQTGAGPVVEHPGDLDALEAAVRQMLNDGNRHEWAERARAAGPEFGVEACAERYAAAFLGQAMSPQAGPAPSGNDRAGNPRP